MIHFSKRTYDNIEAHVNEIRFAFEGSGIHQNTGYNVLVFLNQIRFSGEGSRTHKTVKEVGLDTRVTMLLELDLQL